MTDGGAVARAREIEALIEFAKAKAAEARTTQESRESMAAECRQGTEAEWEEGRRLAERMTGRPMPVTSAADRAKQGDMHARVAARYAREAAAFEAIAAALAERPGAPQRDAAEEAEDRCAYCGFGPQECRCKPFDEPAEVI